MNHRRILALLGAMLLALTGVNAVAQSWPTRPIRLVVPFAAGQGADAASRTVAQKLSERLGQSIVIDNRPGAGGNVGSEAVAKAPADGYTLLVGSNGTHAANAALYANLPFDPIQDFVGIAYIGSVAMVMLAAPSHPASSLQDLVALARSAPGTVSIAIPSSTSRVVFELLTRSSRATFNPVAYKASSAAMTDLIGGHIPFSIDTVIAAGPQVSSGKLKALGVSTASRSQALPGTPTFAEAGFAGFDLAAWNVWFAPRGTPAAIVDRLNQTLREVLGDDQVKARLRSLGYEPGGALDAPAVAGFVRSEATKWGDLIRAAGIKAD
jgi:tripartite-type tricarboxylate transporter receptor subunit TctC